jgi:3-dehydroquinate dehydratase / shikimate dehydrogenase
MLCIPIIGPSLEEASSQIAEAQVYADLIELRLDLFENLDIEHIRTQIYLPVIFTFRKSLQKHMKRLLSLNPTYVDLEHDMPRTILDLIRESFPSVKQILSYHNFTCTPHNLECLIKDLQTIPADFYKIACTAQSTLDALKMLICVKKEKNLIGLCMGEKGGITRILAPFCGSPWGYACLSPRHCSAPGQLSVLELISTYGIRKLTTHCLFYGLIGSPLVTSPSHFTHNQILRQMGVDGIYVKMEIESEELAAFLPLVKQLGFRGLSVTMPLKERIVPLLDKLDPHAASIGAVNTILFQKNLSLGFNTDGKGALDVIETHKKVHGLKVHILGSGGAARAILYEAKKRGAVVTLFNRTAEKATLAAKSLGCKSATLDELSSDAAVLINATPHPLPISADVISSQALVMDIKTIPVVSELLLEAKRKGCTTVSGYEMFIHQALGQFSLWFPQYPHFQEIYHVLKKITLQFLPELQSDLKKTQKIFR